MSTVKKSKIDPTEVVACCIYAVLWLIALFGLANMQRLGLNHGMMAAYFPVFLFIGSIFYIIYLAIHSFWKEANHVFSRGLLAFALLPLLIIVIMVITELH